MQRGVHPSVKVSCVECLSLHEAGMESAMPLALLGFLCGVMCFV